MKRHGAARLQFRRRSPVVSRLRGRRRDGLFGGIASPGRAGRVAPAKLRSRIADPAPNSAQRVTDEELADLFEPLWARLLGRRAPEVLVERAAELSGVGLLALRRTTGRDPGG